MRKPDRRLSTSLLAVIASVACAIGTAVYPGTVFCAPLLLAVALTFHQSNKSFTTVASLAFIGLSAGLVVRGMAHSDSVTVTVALICVIGLAGFWFLSKRPASVSLAPPEPLSQPEDLEVTAMDSGTGSNREDSGPSRIMCLAISERLAASGKFTVNQLESIKTEIDTFFKHHADSEVSFFCLPKGTWIGDYRIEELLGQGGSGQVYVAHPRDGGQTVALKMLQNAHTTDRFNREMTLVQRLAHPNVVIAYEVGNHHETPFIVMEHLSGPDLYEHVQKSGPMSWQQTVNVILQAARGLDHAHRRGLVHRDVKPANLIWDGDRIKIADLGLAALSSSSNESDFRTHHDSVAGSPDFMSPEQAHGLGNATEVSDIYSLASTWYFLLTGESRVNGHKLRDKLACLFSGKDFKALPTSLLPKPVHHVWEKMVSYDASQRYQSLAEVIEAIEDAMPTGEESGIKNSVTVLVVEDNEDDMFLTVEMLKRSNKSIRIVTANTLKESIDICSQPNVIDLVLLDLRLPDSAGVETVERLREVLQFVPIIVLTGQHDVTIGEGCIAAGADEFACKNDLNAHLMERMIFITLSRSRHRLRSDVYSEQSY